jgi:hypothetical protein
MVKAGNEKGQDEACVGGGIVCVCGYTRLSSPLILQQNLIVFIGADLLQEYLLDKRCQSRNIRLDVMSV